MVMSSFTDPIEQLYNAPGGPGNIFRDFLAKRLPRGASGTYRNYARGQEQPYEELFEQFRGLGDIGPKGGLDAPGTNYQDFLNQQGGSNFGFGAPDPGLFRGLANRASQLISGPPEGLKSTPLAYRQSLIETPRRQFELAVQSVLPSVPLPLQGWLERVAQDAFDQWMTANPQGTTEPAQGFLPQFINRGYSFF